MNRILEIFNNIPEIYKKIGIPVLIVLFVVFGYVLYYQGQKIKQYQDDLAELDEEIQLKKSEIDRTIESLEGQQRNLLTRFSDLSLVISNQIYSDQIGKDFFKFIDNPNGKRLYREQQKIIINEIYKDFFYDIDLNDSDIEELKNLLVDKQMVSLEIIISLLKGDMTGDQVAENEKKFNEMIQRADNNIRDFFQYDEYEDFLDYELTLEYRNLMMDLKDHFASKDIFLDQYQQESLLDLIIIETENFDFTEDILLADINQNQKLTEEQKQRIYRYIDEREQLDGIIVNKARVFLNSEETDILEQFLRLKRNMDELGIEVSNEKTTEVKQ